MLKPHQTPTHDFSWFTLPVKPLPQHTPVLPNKWKNILHPRCTYKGGDLLTSVSNVLDLSPKEKESGVLCSIISGSTSHSRPSLLFSSTLSLFFSKVTLFFSVLNVCYVLNTLFVCIYTKICLKWFKSEAEYRIEMILYSILTSYFI